MNKKTIFVTGATGFLGKHLCLALLKKGYSVVGTGHSEASIKDFERTFNKTIPIYQIDISSSYSLIKTIIKKHSIEYIIHAAAMKHVGICEDNPSRAINVNILGSQQIIRAAIDSNITNVIAISTDKSVNPLCVYGMTKKLMEDIFLEHNFGVFQGVNFLFSSGSVLDIWDDMKNKNKTIFAHPTAKRYFCLIEEVCTKIINSLDKKAIFSINQCYNISIADLQKAFSTYHNYWNVKEHIPLEVEKQEEELLLNNIIIHEPTIEEIVELLSKHYKRETIL